MDYRVEAFWDHAYDKFGFGAGVQVAAKCGIRRSLGEEPSSLFEIGEVGTRIVPKSAV